ncbi:MAG: type I DNA topoisomerase [Holosporaceae bacterium]|jgi:DNA topoisomerase-1|nr:type I DNA topoisomerase [Holosporaceae bacterium]
MRLVVVESPAKAKTINKYLGKEYKVVASYGHVRNLLSKDGSVRPEDGFSMIWDIDTSGKKRLNEIASQLKGCDELLLATDPDREGEAISWHIKELLQEGKKLKVPFKRVVFHEITRSAIEEALANPRGINASLVDAYLTRCALDYLIGFTLSPILWRKLPGSKSAGRVQSVALRMISDRETEIEAFEKKEFWSIEGKFIAKDKKIFGARLTHYKGEKLEKFSINNSKYANSIKEALISHEFSATSVEKKVAKRNPAPAFITSTLQQEASRKLGFGAKKTMQLAQNLYEGIDINGERVALITYMRTDSVNLSKEAIERIRDLIFKKYGDNFAPEKARIYHTKVKNAQEAHEAIRPIDAFVTPDSLKDNVPGDLYKLYDLIWKRAVASQMSSAEFEQVQVDISDKEKNIFRANGNTMKFEGFIKVYVEGKDDEEEEDGALPVITVRDQLPTESLEALQHFTTPPPRFSEASLVKKMEELGIGRPSTYANILQVLRDRGYAKLEKKFFTPEIRGRLVTSFLTSFFSKYLEYGFTANLEQSLDDISNGNKTKLEILTNFWKDFCQNVDTTKGIKISDVINKLNESLEAFLFRTEKGDISRSCPECKTGELSLKIGKFGSFVGCSKYPECKYVRKLDSSPMTNEDKTIMQSSEYPKFLGTDPADNTEISLRKGPYGLYIQKDFKKSQEKPQRAAIPSFLNPVEVDLKMALALLQFPKNLGNFEGEEVKIGLGKYGPYALHKGKYASLPQTPDIFTMNLDDAIAAILKKHSR